MKQLIEHRILSSFKEWFDHTLLYEGEAFFNIPSGQFYSMGSGYGLSSFNSPHNQWVYDHSITGATIPTASGIGVDYIDYKNGRVLGNAPSGTVSYSVKEVNIYTTTKSDQELIFSTKFNTRPQPYDRPISSGLAPNTVIAPCAILKCESVKASDIQLGGGVIEKKMQYSSIIITDSEFLLHGVGNIFADKQNTSFPILPHTLFNKYGDYKTEIFNYDTLRAGSFDQGEIVFIKDTQFTPIQHDSISKVHPSLYFAKITFNLGFYKGLNRTSVNL
jgi:hypothetical protein